MYRDENLITQQTGLEGLCHMLPETREERSCSVYLVPSELYECFTQSHNLMDIHALAKLRSVASIQDVADIEIMSNEVIRHLLGSSETGGLFDCLVHSDYRHDSPSDKEDFEHYLTQIALSSKLTSTIERVKNRLNDSGEYVHGLYNATEPYSVTDHYRNFIKPYNIITRPDKVYVLINYGFLKYLQEEGAKYKFSTDVLRAMYSVSPISVVNRTDFYKLYLKNL